MNTAPPNANGCRLWTGAVWDNTGYPRFNRGGTSVPAYRVAWELANGPIPNGLWVCHKCDVGRCLTITHMFLGTPADNSADMARKGRAAKGEKNGGGGKLTAAKVLTIRGAYESGVVSQQRLADAFGVTQGIVSAVVKRAIWKHV